MVIKLINIQITESKVIGVISCALTRLECKVGMPISYRQGLRPYSNFERCDGGVAGCHLEDLQKT